MFLEHRFGVVKFDNERMKFVMIKLKADHLHGKNHLLDNENSKCKMKKLNKERFKFCEAHKTIRTETNFSLKKHENV